MSDRTPDSPAGPNGAPPATGAPPAAAPPAAAAAPPAAAAAAAPPAAAAGVGAPQAWAAAPPGQPTQWQAGTGAPPAGAPPVGPPTQWAPPPAPGGYGPSPASRPGGSRGLKIALAVAAALAALLLVVAVIGFVGGKDPATSGSSGTAGGTAPAGSDTPTGGGGEPTGGAADPGGGGDEAPDSGTVRALIQDKVGRFELVDGESDTSAIDDGATEAYALNYQDSGGAKILHTVAAYGSASDAADLHAGVAKGLAGKGYKVVTTDKLDNGGSITLLAKDTATIVLWNNDVLFCAALGKGEDPIEFFKELKY
jgi:hypothetical protein